MHIYAQVMRMVNITISVSNELKKQLDEHPEMNWSEVARQAWTTKIQQLELLNTLTSKSKATDKDIEEFGKMLKKGIASRHNRIKE